MVKERHFNKKWGTLETVICCGFFNPFKRRIIAEIIPVFNFVPQIGVSLDIHDKSYHNSYHIGIHICFLNFELRMWFNMWFKSNSVNTKKVIRNGNTD